MKESITQFLLTAYETILHAVIMFVSLSIKLYFLFLKCVWREEKRGPDTNICPVSCKKSQNTSRDWSIRQKNVIYFLIGYNIVPHDII
jgi:hypothetical protein